MSSQKVNRTLLIRPKIIASESLQSYLIRLARTNGYTYKAFSAGVSANSKPHRSMKLADRQEIRSLIEEISDPNSSELADVWECAHYQKQIFDYSRIKFCNQCYQEEKLLPPHWWLKNYLICTKHKALLVDSCPECNTRLNEDSFIKEQCANCEVNFQLFQHKVCEPDSYSALLDKAFSTFVGNTQHFILRHNENARKTFIQHNIGSFLLKGLQGQTTSRDNRRNFSIEELSQSQHDCQELINEGIREALIKYLSKIKKETSKAIPSAFSPILDLLNQPEGACFKDALIQILLTPPDELANWPLEVSWLEKFLDIPVGEIERAITEKYPEYRSKSQGRMKIEIKNIGFIINEFSLSNDSK